MHAKNYGFKGTSISQSKHIYKVPFSLKARGSAICVLN